VAKGINPTVAAEKCIISPLSIKESIDGYIFATSPSQRMIGLA